MCGSFCFFFKLYSAFCDPAPSFTCFEMCVLLSFSVFIRNHILEISDAGKKVFLTVSGLFLFLALQFPTRMYRVGIMRSTTVHCQLKTVSL